VDFRGHIALPGALVFVEFGGGLLGLEVSGKPKVTNFEDVVAVLQKDENVLQFEIAMGHPLPVQVD
jgi:hypothetical protein